MSKEDDIEKLARQRVDPAKFWDEAKINSRNVILCPACFKGGEEKCCSHGIGAAKCADCGATRQYKDEPAWHCIGSMPDVIFRADKVGSRDE